MSRADRTEIGSRERKECDVIRARNSFWLLMRCKPRRRGHDAFIIRTMAQRVVIVLHTEIVTHFVGHCRGD